MLRIHSDFKTFKKQTIYFGVWYNYMIVRMRYASVLLTLRRLRARAQTGAGTPPQKGAGTGSG